MAIEVLVKKPVTVVGRLYEYGPFEIPGIAAADALDANDTMGRVFALEVPTAGAIVSLLFHDLDDEGLNKELWLFQGAPTAGGVSASDAAFALDDQTNLLVRGVLSVNEWKDGVNNQIGKTADLPFWYVAPSGKLWCVVKTAGADNIAAGSMPAISLVIERYADE